jgi:hypothetical protein
MSAQQEHAHSTSQERGAATPVGHAVDDVSAELNSHGWTYPSNDTGAGKGQFVDSSWTVVLDSKAPH